MKTGNGLAVLTLLWGGAGVAAPAGTHAAFEEDLQVQMFRYATEASPTAYLSSKSVITTDNFGMRVDGYYESGSRGAWFIDPDPIRYTVKLGAEGESLAFLGRNHPLDFTRGRPVDATSALGTVWTQNQLEALHPRVSGWIGGGIVHDVGHGLRVTAAYSPIFLPTFGPSLGLSERGELNPSRFARTPPATASVGGIITPIRYKIDAGQISELVLRHQAMLAVSRADGDLELDVYAYTAPRPNPVAAPNAVLGVTATDVNAKVDVAVQFPREHWAGTRARLKRLPFEPAIELVQKLDDLGERYVSITGYWERASFGLLTHWGKQFDAPTFSDFLLFVSVPVRLSDQVEWRSMAQTTWLPLRQSLYWINEVEWAFARNVSALGAVRLLAGEDDSYFGDWRNQDSWSAGLRWTI